MAYYYVNKNRQQNGDHEVHRADCGYLPSQDNRIYLGDYNDCHPAVQKAKQYYPSANGCYFCSNACHTS